MSLTSKHVIIIGTSGICLAVAARAAAEDAQVTVASSSQDRVDAALKQLPGGARGARLDATHEAAIQVFLGEHGPFDHLVFTAGEPLLLKPDGDVTPAEARAFFETRYWGVFLSARYAAARLRPGGSITFTSGTVATRPAHGASVPASVAGAIEALTRALAIELSPVRVNAVRPGPVRTDMWASTVPEPQALYEQFAAELPVKRVAEASEIAAAYTYLMETSSP
jgi:NAD(P)-dependent dehydrogenase (short-subunit alcohol dehydrogenase family)